MIAAVIALCGVNALLAGFMVTLGVWMRSDRKTADNLRDVVDASQRDAADFESRWRVVAAELAVTADQLEREQNLRTIAEAQRNEAMRRVRELLGRHIKTATLEEIQEMTNDAFASPLSVVPRPDGVPLLPAAEAAGSDDILDPWARVQPSKPAG